MSRIRNYVPEYFEMVHLVLERMGVRTEAGAIRSVCCPPNCVDP